MAGLVSTSRSSASRLGPAVLLRNRVRDLVLAKLGDRRRTRRPGAPRRPEAGDGRRTSPRHDRGPPLGQRPARPPARAARHTQLNVRVYARHRGETGRRLPRAPRQLLGMERTPRHRFVQRARARRGGGRQGWPRAPLRAPGAGRSSELGTHDVALFEAAGLRELRIRRGEASWERGGTGGTGRADRSRPRVLAGRSARAPLRAARVVRGRATGAACSLDPRRAGGCVGPGARPEPRLDALVQLGHVIALADADGRCVLRHSGRAAPRTAASTRAGPRRRRTEHPR